MQETTCEAYVLARLREAEERIEQLEDEQTVAIGCASLSVHDITSCEVQFGKDLMKTFHDNGVTRTQAEWALKSPAGLEYIKGLTDADGAPVVLTERKRGATVLTMGGNMYRLEPDEAKPVCFVVHELLREPVTYGEWFLGDAPNIDEELRGNIRALADMLPPERQ